jgi:histidine phosphotransfer protein HptB
VNFESDSVGDPERSSGEVVEVDPDIQDLVPRFLENQRTNAARILDLAAATDFDTVRRMGHNMKGTGKGYGFNVISSFGAAIEQAASRGSETEIQKLASELRSYVAAVRWRPRAH